MSRSSVIALAVIVLAQVAGRMDLPSIELGDLGKLLPSPAVEVDGAASHSMLYAAAMDEVAWELEQDDSRFTLSSQVFSTLDGVSRRLRRGEPLQDGVKDYTADAGFKIGEILGEGSDAVELTPRLRSSIADVLREAARKLLG